MYDNNEARIDAIVNAAERGDSTVVPMLREALEQALMLYSDSSKMIERAAAEAASRPEAERAAAMMDVLTFMHRFDDLLVAAMQIPDATLEQVLKTLSQRISHRGVRDALAKVRAVKPASAHSVSVRDHLVVKRGFVVG